ncbi:O-methyltransferase, family 2 [Metarhizium guizhouense ARSEF 977]|uniref:O-methyltransferase, family 2 n=1 Tax=Metarhizium guizhouense (strain ARSEF 977) TaxID=1276136 RepID=A0A0B4HRW6_METGA|nr:O-methyltransferase, family 2 [Metarhizium guizhouense ARSEF 977]
MNAPGKNSLILQKARETLRQSEALVDYLETHGIDEPNFTAFSPAHPADKKYDDICTDLSQVAKDLILLAQGPMRWLRIFFCSHHDLGAWQAALRFGYFTIVPLNRPMMIQDIASAARMDVDRTRRIMKLLASQRCFQEVEEDVYEHTAMSAFIAQERNIRSAMAFQAEEIFEASSLTAASIAKEPFASHATNSAFNLRFGTSPYQWFMANPERGERFASAMAGLVQSQDTTEIRDRFPWANLRNKTIVDVGGGSGHIAVYLATQFPGLKFIVQDINPLMLSQGPKLPDFIHVQNRVSFMRYDFFQPQPIESAGLFFLRQIAHNYPDDVCVKIFKNFVPALEKCGPGTSLLLNDMVLPQANTVPKVEEHLLRQLDMAMLNSYAAKQRTLKEFTKLLHEADPRLEVVNVHGKGIMGLLEVQLCQRRSQAADVYRE